MMAGVWQDFRYSFRSLRRAPGFSLAAVVLLATGIGLSSTAFSLVRAYLVTPLPYPESDRVVQVIIDASRTFTNTPRRLDRVDIAGLRDTFSETAAWDLDGFTVVGGEQPEYVSGAWVNPGFFAIVGARPHLGRLLGDTDVRDNSRAVVISHAYWQRRFGGRRDIVNQTLRAFSTDRPLEADIFTIVGVLPADFWHVNAFTDILAPLQGPRLPSLARLAPGVTINDAIGRLNAEARATIPDASPEWRMTLVPVQEEYALRIRPTVLILFAAVGGVLLVASANVAGLLLVRSIGRRHELSVRAALGAGRGRIVRQLLIESVALALAAGVAGLWLTFVSVDVLAVWIESQLGLEVPGGVQSVRLDPAVAAFALVTTLVVGVVTGLRPALSAALASPGSALASVSRGANPAARGRFRAVMVISQVALTFVLLAGAGLMVRTLMALQDAELGFTPEAVLKAHVLLPQARYPDAPARVTAIGQVLEHVGAVPGVQAVATVMPHPFRLQAGQPLDAEGTNAQGAEAVHHVVAGDYWRTMNIRVLEGRVFEPADRAGAERVAVVSATVARRLWPDRSAIGRRIRTTTATDAPWRTIIGVVADVRKTYTERLVGDTYVPFAQAPGGYFALMVRGIGDPGLLSQPVQRGLAAVAPDLPMHEVEPMTQVVERQGRQRRFLAVVLGVFAALTTAIALVGLYTVLSFTVTMRTREIAVRVAIGASGRQIRGSVLREGAGLVAAGVVGGLGLSLLLSRMIAAQLYGVSQFDAMSYAVAGALFGVVSLAAVYAPAMRAARIDPIAALRAD